MVANTRTPQPTPDDVALKVWLENVAEVVAAILTRRAHNRDDEAETNQEDGHEDS